MEKSPDIVIFGAGIAGLWLFHALKKAGYDVLLLERGSIGCGQTIAAQGIIHSGLKFSLAGKISTLAKSISMMPDRWRDALIGKGEVDLSSAKTLTSSQLLLIPSGVMGGIVKLVTQKTLGKSVEEIERHNWPEALIKSGFKGFVVSMNELVLDVPSVLHALAEPYKASIRKITPEDSVDALGFLKNHNLAPKKIIFTAAESNQRIARRNHHDKGLETQARPLVQGMLRPAPFPLFAHLVGVSEKPVATITTHTAKDGSLIWYLGAAVAERAKSSHSQEVIAAAKKAFADYFPALDLSAVQWATLPIDRIEGKSKTDGWMPDTPTIHHAGDILYCWPTKLTFAPLLYDMVLRILTDENLKPSSAVSDFSFLPPVEYAQTPWDNDIWTK